MYYEKVRYGKIPLDIVGFGVVRRGGVAASGRVG